MEGQDPATGRFVGGNPGGPGRKPLPRWLLESDDELLRVMFDAATKGRLPLSPAGELDDPELGDDGAPVPASRTQVVPAQWRIRAAEALLNRIRGRPPLADESGGPNETAKALADLYAAVGSDRPG